MQEVEIAAKSLQEGKSPRLDVFTTDFFHSCWNIIKEEVCSLVERSRQTKSIIYSFNATFLTLIPKGHYPSNSDKFRPIDLCNVIYKIITKVITSILNPLLPLLISEEQTGYVEGRIFLDGILPAHEFVHSINLTKKPGMEIKIDMLKEELVLHH